MARFDEVDEKDRMPDTGDLTIPKNRRRGRPAGGLNKPKEGSAADLQDRVKKIYDIIEYMLPPDQREYYQRAFSGKEAFDPMKHAEFFSLLYSVYANDVLIEAIDKKIVSQDIAQTLREFRMALKELDDMQRARKKEEDKANEHGKLADPTRESSQSNIDKIIERASKKGTGRVSGRTGV